METTALSTKALADLRLALHKTYGEDLADSFSIAELNQIGVVILTGLVESLKIEIAESNLLAS